MESVSASTTGTDVSQLRDQLDALERQREQVDAQRAGIDREIALLRGQLAPILAAEAQQAVIERARDPRSFEDLLGDPSYEDDSGFTRNEFDEQRVDAYRTRTSEADRAASDVRRLEAELGALRSLQETGPGRIEQLKGVVRAVNGSLGARFTNLFSGQRETAQRELADLESRLAASYGEMNRVAAALVAARQRAEESRPNETYSADLHAEDVPFEGLIPRTGATVLLSYSAGSRRSPSTVTIHLPNTAYGTDFTRTLTLELEGDDLEEFLTLVGKDIPSRNGAFDTVGENAEYEYDFEDEVVPFPLEQIEVRTDGVRGGTVRLPQVVWERFKGNVVA